MVKVLLSIMDIEILIQKKGQKQQGYQKFQAYPLSRKDDLDIFADLSEQMQCELHFQQMWLVPEEHHEEVCPKPSNTCID